MKVEIIPIDRDTLRGDPFRLLTNQSDTPTRAEAEARLTALAELLEDAIALAMAGDNTGSSALKACRAIYMDIALKLLAALPLGRCETCREWQPIETAPQMRKILVSYVNALGKRRVVLACYYLANALEMDDDYADVGIYDEATGNSYAPEGWYEEHDSDNPIMSLQADPTHWMPLPAPPASGEETRDGK